MISHPAVSFRFSPSNLNIWPDKTSTITARIAVKNTNVPASWSPPTEVYYCPSVVVERHKRILGRYFGARTISRRGTVKERYWIEVYLVEIHPEFKCAIRHELLHAIGRRLRVYDPEWAMRVIPTPHTEELWVKRVNKCHSGGR